MKTTMWTVLTKWISRCSFPLFLLTAHTNGTQRTCSQPFAKRIVAGALVVVASAASSASISDGIAAFNSGKGDVALKTLRPLADGGDAVAQCYVARILNGVAGGVRRDLPEAKLYAERAWTNLRSAAAGGNAAAQACLGDLISTSAFGPFQIIRERPD